MSIFGKIKSSKKAAAEHRKAAADAAAVEASKPPPPPYRHVPTHAAQDAITGTPSSTDVDRAAVRRANHRRSTIRNDSYYNSSSSRPISRNYSAESTWNTGANSSASLSRPQFIKQTSHPGMVAYDALEIPRADRAQWQSRNGKSPLSSVPITPLESYAPSSAESSSSRSYHDRESLREIGAAVDADMSAAIQHPTTFSHRLSAEPRKAAHYHSVRETAPRPWEVAAARNGGQGADKPVQAASTPAPLQATKKSRFSMFGRKRNMMVAAAA